MSDDGTIVASGAPHHNADSGHVQIVERVDNAWVPKGSIITGSEPGHLFGQVVSLSGDGETLAVGVPGSDTFGMAAGQVSLFQFVDGDWVPRGDAIGGEAPNNRSGEAVALSSDGDTVVIGAYLNSGAGSLFSFRGHARVYTWVSNAWVQVGADIDGVSDGDGLGWSVAINDNGRTVALGAKASTTSYGEGAGHVALFTLVEGNWAPKGELLEGRSPGENSGWSVALDGTGTAVAIGAPSYGAGGSNSGAVRVHDFVAGDWAKRGDTIEGDRINGGFGASVSLSSNGSRLASGAPGLTGTPRQTGEVRIFEFGADQWSQLGTSVEGTADQMQAGYAVALSSDGGTVALGAPSSGVPALEAGVVQVYSYPADKQLVSMGTAGATYLPGIYLHVAGPLGRTVAGSPVYFGSDRVHGDSRYSLTVTPVVSGNKQGTVLATGHLNTQGTLGAQIVLPHLAPGEYDIVMRGTHHSGTGLSLTHRIRVGTGGHFTEMGQNVPAIE
jgi:hypothetical protein